MQLEYSCVTLKPTPRQGSIKETCIPGTLQDLQAASSVWKILSHSHLEFHLSYLLLLEGLRSIFIKLVNFNLP